MGRTANTPPPRRVAQDFADYVNGVINATVSDARLTLLAIPGQESRFVMACLDGNRSVPFALFGTSLLLRLSQTLEIEGDETHTVAYQYRLATGASKEDWLLRWEYFRQPPRPDYEYPLAHVHVNGTLTNERAEEHLAKPTPHLHLPTARVSVELVLWHLIAEWGVKARTTEWKERLRDSIQGFEERRTAP